MRRRSGAGISPRAICAWSCLAALIVAAGGCQTAIVRGAGDLRASSDTASLPVSANVNVFAFERGSDASFYLTDCNPDALVRGDVTRGQLLHVEFLWVPKAGETPMDDSATNITLRHVVIVDGEVGIYVGTGFARIRGALDEDEVGLSIRASTMRLAESTEGFRDVLGVATIRGEIEAVRDPQLARTLHRAASRLVTRAVGEARWVRAEDGPPAYLATAR